MSRQALGRVFHRYPIAVDQESGARDAVKASRARAYFCAEESKASIARRE